MSSLLNRAAVKKYILAKCKSERPGWNCQHVSARAINEIDTFLRLRIEKSVSIHPTKGKTFLTFE